MIERKKERQYPGSRSGPPVGSSLGPSSPRWRTWRVSEEKRKKKKEEKEEET